MDGITEITRWSLLMLEEKSTALSKTFRRHAAIHNIKCQPFYGSYWKTPPSDTIKIRIPVRYSRDWIG